jgi:uncharacterized membrane protein
VDGINPESAPIEGPLRWIELASLGIELLAVGIIVLAIVYATVRYVSESLLATQVDERYERYKRRLGRSLLLGLEILVAADIVRTVALDATLDSVIVLGLLVVIRTFLSWSLVVEIEGRWPWQQNHVAAREERKDDS